VSSASGDSRGRDVVEPQLDRADVAREGTLYDVVPARELWSEDRPSFADRLKRLFLGLDRAPVPSHVGLLEQPAPQRVGICCSGGGVRSAAFNLGALQDLQADGVLAKAKYVAAVSGGSYIAAALAMVAKTSVDSESDDSDPRLVKDERPPFYRGSPEEQYLRNRASYMAPGGIGLWRLVQRVALGLIVNLAFLTSALLLLAWLLALLFRQTAPQLQAWGGPASAASSGDWWIAAAVIGAAALTLGFFALFVSSEHDDFRQACETLCMWLLGGAIMVVVVSKGLPELLAFLRNHNILRHQHQVAKSKGSIGATVGGGASALLLAVLVELRSRLTFKELEADAGRWAKLSAGVRKVITQLAAWVIGPAILAVIFLVGALTFVGTHHILWEPIVGLALAFLVFLIFADVTSWSLHPYYRRRLCTAFALKRVAREGHEDDRFGKAVERQYPRLTRLSETHIQTGEGQPLAAWPILLVCAAANVSDEGATPPGRKVTSFTFSAVDMGGPLVGGIATRSFEDRAQARLHDFTLPAAVAMSGAAISPSMGKETRGAFRFLLGLANVRLGVWVPNPRRVDRWVEGSAGVRKYLDRTDRLGRIIERATPLDLEQTRINPAEEPASEAPASAPGQPDAPVFPKRLWVPRPGAKYLIKEMMGWNSVNDPYLYVTDGGHYENLGLVELLRRGCTEIFCFDASGGKSMSNLGDAIALARSELNVEIDEFDLSSLAEDDERLAASSCALATIHYPRGETGVLVYVRTVVTPSAPYDIQAFRLRDPSFPHTSTVDQLYTDQRFESYRALGSHAAAEARKLFNAKGASRLAGASPASGATSQTGLQGATAAAEPAAAEPPAGNGRSTSGLLGRVARALRG
jgi:hypothetical protein